VATLEGWSVQSLVEFMKTLQSSARARRRTCTHHQSARSCAIRPGPSGDARAHIVCARAGGAISLDHAQSSRRIASDAGRRAI